MGKGIVAAFLAAIGFCLLVSGFVQHLSHGPSLVLTKEKITIFLKYFVGFLFFGVAKLSIGFRKEK